MSYEDIGYDQYMARASSSAAPSGEISTIEADQNIPDLSASKIQGGSLVSPSGRMKLDLEQNAFIVDDGVTELVRQGVLSDGSVGLEIKDANGNTLLKITSDEQYIQSGSREMELNLKNVQLILRNSGGTEVGLVGKDIGGYP